MKLKLIFESGKRSVLIEPETDADRAMLKALFRWDDEIKLRIDDFHRQQFSSEHQIKNIELEIVQKAK
jgi:hypothetical protein